MEKIKIGGIMQSDGRALLRVMSVPKQTGAAAIICGALGKNGINTEMLVQTFDLDDNSHFAIVIAQKDMVRALAVMEEVKNSIEAKGVNYVPDVAIISIFGPHLREKPRVPGLMFASLASMGVNSLAVSNSISSVSCVVEGRDLDPAIEALTEVFDIPFRVAKRPKDW